MAANSGISAERAPAVKALLRVDRARAWRVAVLFVLGGLAGFLLVPVRDGEREVTAVLDGHAVPLDGDEGRTREAIATAARAFVRGRLELAAPGGVERARTREELGARVDGERVAAIAREARDPSSAMRRARARSGTREPLRLPMPVRVDGARAMAALLPIKDELDRGAASARIDVESGKTLPEEPGRRVDAYATLARLDAAMESGAAKVEVVIEPLPPSHAASQIEGAKLDRVLGSFDTKVGEKARDARALRAAAAKVNGVVVLAGETFDFNDTVGGARASDPGESPAGGESLVAGTLHAAAFFAGLEIVERHARMRAGSAIPMGLDALVVHPTVTLRIKNTLAQPVLLVETLKDGVLRAEVRGAARTREVTFARRIDQVTPFAERELADAKVPHGVKVLAQRGVPGFTITRDRIVREGAASVRERAQDRYPPVTQIWRIGSGEPDPHFKAREDTHPELLADEYLTITEGPDAPAPIETHVPGRTGVRGWIVREGYGKPLGDHGADDGTD